MSGAYAGRGRYDRICRETTRPWCAVRDRVRDEYPLDTALQFDDAMIVSRRGIADIRYSFAGANDHQRITEGRMVRPRTRARRAPRVPVERRRRNVGLAVAELLPSAVVIGLAFYAVVRILAGTGPQ